ncbi:hypothetical protein [Absidia glauca]|uniref:Uncharacterized protein n=1 Tax=Absidia glauca TaxID=4829 RepID=A0A163MGP3_ABSGL|nr:hypothetical protein [Absidia glauca]
MLDNNKSDHKQTSSRLKRMLCNKSNVAPLGHNNSKDFDHRQQQKMVQISSPVLQHSTNIYSLASPTRTSFEIQGHSMDAAVSYYDDLYQPLSPPPPIPFGRSRPTQQQGPSSSSTTPFCTTNTIKPVTPSAAHTTPSTTVRITPPRGRRSHSVHHTSHPDPTLHVKYGLRSHLPPMPTPPLPPTISRKPGTDLTPAKKKKNTVIQGTNLDNDKDDKHWRRHSCSSTAQHHHHHHHRSRSSHKQDVEPPLPTPAAMAISSSTNTTAPSFTTSLSGGSSSSSSLTSPPSSLLLAKASPAANAALASSSVSLSSLASSSPPPTPSIITLEKSRSTPLRPHSKIKTYNVSPTTATTKKRLQRYGSDTTLPSATQLERDLEKKKRQQELEDLISGRRGSTLKLSLTPKNTLLA